MAANPAKHKHQINEAPQLRNLEILLVFSIGGKLAAFSVYEVDEVAAPSVIESLPNHVDKVAGLMSLRGEVIPIIDLTGEYSQNFAEKQRVIVITVGDSKIGLLADVHMQVVKGIASDVSELPEKAASFLKPFAKAVVKDQKGMAIPLLDGKLLLNTVLTGIAGENKERET